MRDAHYDASEMAYIVHLNLWKYRCSRLYMPCSSRVSVLISLVFLSGVATFSKMAFWDC